MANKADTSSNAATGPMIQQLQKAQKQKNNFVNGAYQSAKSAAEGGWLSHPIKKSGSGPSSHSNTTHAPAKTSGSVNPAGGPKKASLGKPNMNYAKSTRTLISAKGGN